MHSFSCAGVLEAQYAKFCKFALLGYVGHKYVKQGMRCCCYRCSTARNIPCSVYERRGYVSLVAKAAEMSMQSAVEDVVARPEYAKDGEVRNCKSINFPHSNCRVFCSLVGHHGHDSTANAYHTTVPCLSGRCFPYTMYRKTCYFRELQFFAFFANRS